MKQEKASNPIFFFRREGVFPDSSSSQPQVYKQPDKHVNNGMFITVSDEEIFLLNGCSDSDMVLSYSEN